MNYPQLNLSTEALSRLKFLVSLLAPHVESLYKVVVEIVRLSQEVQGKEGSVRTSGKELAAKIEGGHWDGVERYDKEYRILMAVIIFLCFPCRSLHRLDTIGVIEFGFDEKVEITSEWRENPSRLFELRARIHQFVV